MSKKLTTQFAAETSKLGDIRLTVFDKSSKKTFLVDTGAAVSTIPPTISDRSKQDVITQLSAANDSAIATFGERKNPNKIRIQKSSAVEIHRC